MKMNKGFSLVEVIVAIALIGIIATGLIGAFSNNLLIMMRTSDLTERIFSVQESLELEIEDIREKIALGSTVGNFVLNDVFESGITVTVRQLNYTKDSETFNTLISNTTPPDLKVPIAKDVTATLKKSGVTVDKAYALSTTSVVGSNTIQTDTMDVFMVSNYNWYVSRAGFNLPYPDAPVHELNVGTIYPKFPEDYMIIAGETTTTLNNVTNYAGKHIVFAVTPAAKSGKMGKTVPSNPVYISGLPVVSNDLILHLDASAVDKENNSEYTVATKKIPKWQDLSSYNKSAIQSTEGNQPLLKENPIGVDFVGNYVDFDSLKTLVVSHSELNTRTIHAFSVTKGDPTTVYYTNGSQTMQSNGEDLSNGWKLNYLTYTSASDSITLGNSDANIAELILYKGTLSAADIEKVKKYLRDKYRPLDMVGEIVKLINVNKEITQFDEFSMPGAVLADMVYGANKYVPVTWNTTLTSNTQGTFTAIGRAISDTTKEMTYTLKVNPTIPVASVSLDKKNLTLLPGNTELIKATVMPVNAYNKTVTWTSSKPSNVSIVANGSEVTITAISATPINDPAVITVTTADGNKVDTCSVTVNSNAIVTPALPNGLVLSLDANIGQEYQLYNGNNYVKKWIDQTAVKNDFSQSTLSYMPQFVPLAINGLPSIKFIQDNDEFLSYSAISIEDVKMFTKNRTDFTLFIVGKATNNFDTLFSQISNNKVAFSLEYQEPSKFNVSVNNSVLISVTGNENTNIHAVKYSGTNLLYRLNKSQVGATTTSNFVNSDGDEFKVGKSHTDRFLNGEINEVLVFNRALTDSEVILVENYLHEKWIKTRSKAWEFNTTNAASSLVPSSITNLNWDSVTYISGTINGIDPHFYFPALASSDNVNLTNNKTIKIRLKNDTPSTTAQIYFTTHTSGDGNPDETKRVNFPILPNSGFTEYTIDMTSNSKWDGLLKQFRIDPATYADTFTGPFGSFQIDYVRIFQ